jgi:hypothetical protein
MTRVGRLAGALLIETGGSWFLVGHLKQPCDFVAAGFAPPAEVDARAPTGIRLEPIATPTMAAPWIELAVEGDAVVPLCASRFLIERTSLVSERLWRLVTDGDRADARWLGEVPEAVWGVVRDAVLRCS